MRKKKFSERQSSGGQRRRPPVESPGHDQLAHAVIGAVVGGIVAGPVGAVAGAALGAGVEKGPTIRKPRELPEVEAPSPTEGRGKAKRQK